MSNAVKELKQKEKELETALSEIPLFKDLQSIRAAIAVFERGTSENGSQSTFQRDDLPNEYSDKLSWKDKILVALSNLKHAAPIEVVEELKRLGETKEDDWLQKRVSVMLSYMKRKKIVGTKTMGGKTKYFIK